MAATTPTNVDVTIREHWSRKTWRKTLRDTYWDKFVGGEMSGMPIIRKTELVGDGDLVHISITDALSGAGVSGDTAMLEGNEENLAATEIKMNTTLYRHAVRSYRRAQKKSLMNLREEASFRLAEWGRKKMDAIRFSQFVSTTAADTPDAVYTPNIHVVGGGADVDAIAATDKLTVAECKKIMYALDAQQADPFIINGEPHYFLVATPQMVYDLKQDSAYDSYVVNAENRGASNPVFTGALANIDGLVIHKSWSVPVAANATSVATAKSLAFGREAFVEAVDESVTWVEDTFDYENQFGVAYSFAFGPRRALERNSLQVYCASEAPA